jgi:hypothetical protein
MIHKRCRTGACMACRFERDTSGQLELIPGHTGWQYPAQHVPAWPSVLLTTGPALGPNFARCQPPTTSPEAALLGPGLDSKPTAGRGRYSHPKET